MLWWLSFVDDKTSRGVAIVEAPEFLDAVREAHRLEINPGGEVQGFAAETPEEIEELRSLGVGRLITPEELRAKGYQSVREMDEEQNVH
jgi:hypothetical protein